MSDQAETPWITVKEAARYAKCGTKSIYLGVASGKLKAARLGGRRELRFVRQWLDEWLWATSAPVLVHPAAPDASASRSSDHDMVRADQP
jgi:excisionase family DNA binding protein